MASPSSPNPKDSRNIFEFSLRTTQVGVHWNAPPLEDWRTFGRLEFDLQGGAPSITMQSRLRHAYFTLTRGSWEALVGQTWDVISPLRADSITFPAEGWPGDIGQRRPLIALTWRSAPATAVTVACIMAVGQFTQGLQDPASGQVVETTHVPAVMGRVTANFPLASRMAQVSLWGHLGQKGYSAHGGIPAGAIQTSSIGTSLLLPLGARWAFRAEFWDGRVGDANYSANMSRGTLGLMDVLQSRGGWGQVSFEPRSEWRFNVGLGRQHPRTLKAPEQGAQQIASWFANGFRTLDKRFEVGVECSNWDSRFPGASKSNNTLRSQLSLTYRF